MGVFDREHYYRDLLAKQVGGRTEVTLPFGRADVMTDTMVWEVEPASRYPAGVRQALQYASQTGLTAALATYGPGALVTKVFDHLARLPAPGVELWWLYERQFVPVKNAKEAGAIAARATGDQSLALPPKVTCEVIKQDDEVVRSCDGRPVIWKPMRLCQEHVEEVLHIEPPIPPPVINKYRPPQWTKGRALKTAEEMADAAQSLAQPHLDPDSNALLAAYLVEVRSLLWHGAVGEPDGPELFGFGEVDYGSEED